MLPASKAAKTRYIWTDSHQLIPVPSSVKDTLKTVPPLTKPLLGTVLKEPLAKQQLLHDESVYDFFCRRFSSEVGYVCCTYSKFALCTLKYINIVDSITACQVHPLLSVD